MSRPVSIAVDAVGGDFAPKVVLEGVEAALSSDSNITVHLVGPADIVGPFAARFPGRIVAVPASEVIGMDEHPANAVRSKKDSSIVVGSRLVKEGICQGFFSAGSTGACMAAATLVMGRIRGVGRPALATVLPGAGRPTILLDVGANADCKPENLLQFGIMGKAYAQAVFDLKDPKIALLNIGEEDTKGSVLAQEANALMRASLPGFVGNAEGRDLLSGEFDVIVTDGFTGNVALKLLEGSTKILLGRVKNALMSSTVKKIFAAPLAGSIKSLKNDMDPDQFGGAPLLGVKGVCAIGHGSSSAHAIESGILVTARAVRNDLTDILTRNIDNILKQDVG